MAQKEFREATNHSEKKQEPEQKPIKATVELHTEDLVGGGKSTPAPPEAPQIRRRVSFYRTQAIGMPLILLLPILGLCGVFDNHTREVVVRRPEVKLAVRYPDRWRDTSNAPITVSLTNLSGKPKAFEVSVDRQLLERMEDVQFNPEPDRSDAASYVFEVDSLPSGASEIITIDFKAYDSGIYQGRVTASSQGSDVAKATFQTLVLP